MSTLRATHPATCPYCGEPIELVLDLSAGDQSYIEDCEVCCRPMQVTVNAEDGELLDVSVETSE